MIMKFQRERNLVKTAHYLTDRKIKISALSGLVCPGGPNFHCRFRRIVSLAKVCKKEQ